MKNSIQKFFRKDSSAGIMLLAATLAALIIANSPLNDLYNHVLELEFSKIGVLAGSLISGIAGYLLLKSKTQYKTESQQPLNLPE